MAIYHLSFKTASKGTGRSAGAHARYIEREGKYEMSRANEALEYKASGNMPEWADGKELSFWDASDLHERANGRVYSELEIALPREMTPEQRRELVKEFIETELTHQPYTVAIHNKIGLDGGEQPHAHIMFSERQIDGIERSEEHFFKRANDKEPERGGSKKNRDWNRREKVTEIRSAWGLTANRALIRAGIDQQIDSRSLSDQGIDRVAEPKMGAEVTQMLKAGKSTDVSDRVIELRHYKTLEKEVRELKEELQEERGRVYHFGERTFAEREEQSFSFERAGKAREVPEEEQKQYQKVLDLAFTKVERGNGHTEYQWNRSGRTAFIDEGDRITFSNTNETSIKAAIQLAKQKGWEGASVSGSEQFRQEFWIQGKLYGVEVTGYEPSKADELEVERRSDELALKKAQYRAQDKERERERGKAPEQEKERDGPTSTTVLMRASSVHRSYERHTEKKEAEYAQIRNDIVRLNQQLRPNFTEQQAKEIAEGEFTGGRNLELTKELSRGDREVEQAEREYKQFQEEKGLSVLLPGNARQQSKQLFKGWEESWKLQSERIDEWNTMKQEMGLPENQKHIDDRARELVLEHKEREERRTELHKEYEKLGEKLAPFRKVMEKLRTLGDREIELIAVPGKDKQIVMEKLDKQIREREAEQQNEQSMGRGRELER